jgi:hypothetical protein
MKRLLFATLFLVAGACSATTAPTPHDAARKDTFCRGGYVITSGFKDDSVYTGCH